LKHCLYLLILLSFSCALQAQEVIHHEQDSIENSEILFVPSEIILTDSIEIAPLVIDQKQFVPNPTKAALFSAVVPGLGQIYNRKYWKLPIVYGGFLGCVYAINWNTTTYNGYKDAYRDYTDNNVNTNSWQAYVPSSLPKDENDWSSEQKEWFKTNLLKQRKDYYRRYRDLSYIITGAFYALCIIDAYVDAQLFDFDISEDLSLRVEPTITTKTSFSPQTFGLRCSFTF